MLTTARSIIIIVVATALTGVLGFFASQSGFDDGVGIDNELSDALDTIDQRFADPTTVLQIVVRSTDGSDVRSADALRYSLELQQHLQDAAVGDTLAAAGDQPPIVSYLGAAEAVVQERGLEPAELDELDDEQVRELQDEGRGFLPDEAAAQLDQLIADPPEIALTLVFQDTDGLDEDEELERQQELASTVEELDTPDGLEVTALSVALLLEDDSVGAEIGRLFGTALAIILVVLAIVFWMKPQDGHRARIVRRTAADVGLTLLIIVFAVVWMQGLGVLLGPSYLGLIGEFNNQTQVVPILIVALGVDFSIHLLARYRTETGTAADPVRGYRRALVTVGVALLLDTAATAIGFLTNLVSPVESLRTLGVLAALGIVAAFLLTMTLLPAIRVLLDRRASTHDRLPAAELAGSDASALPQVMGRVAAISERAPMVVLVATLGATGVGVYGFTQLDSRFALTDFVPQDDPALQTFETVQDAFGGGFDETTDVLLVGDVATTDAHDALRESLDRAADVEGVETLDEQADATSVFSILGRASGDEDLAAELGELGLQDDLSIGSDEAVADVYGLLLDEVEQADAVLSRDEADGWATRVELRTSAGQQETLRLRAELLEAFAPLDDAGVDAIPVSQEMLQASVSDEIEAAQLRSIAIALGAVMLLLAGFFAWRRRQPMIGVLTVLPVAFVLALTFGMMALTDIPLNPVTATLAALSIGIGVPFNIHVAARYLEERDAGDADDGDDGDSDGGHSPLRRAVSSTGGAVVASALTTGIGFGVLTTSTLLPFEQLGFVIVYAIVWSAIAATIVLPSLLTLWERHRPTSA